MRSDMPRIEARPLVSIDLEGLEVFYRGHSRVPYAHYPGLGADRLAAHAAAQARAILTASGTTAFSLATGAGFAAFQTLGWDSRVLGLPAARVAFLELAEEARTSRATALKAARALGTALANTMRASGARHVSARLDARDIVLIQALEEQGFRFVDSILRFALDLHPLLRQADDVVVRDARIEDLDRLRELAASGFIYDRFHNDPALPSTVADRLHAEWVENAVRGGYGCGVLVAEAEGRPAGFFILSEDPLARETLGVGIGTLVLITVAPEARRRGIARALSLASAVRLRERGNRFAEVGTQLANIPASNTYLTAGFRLVQTSVSLRWWRDHKS